MTHSSINFRKKDINQTRGLRYKIQTVRVFRNKDSENLIFDSNLTDFLVLSPSTTTRLIMFQSNGWNETNAEFYKKKIYLKPIVRQIAY